MYRGNIDKKTKILRRYHISDTDMPLQWNEELAQGVNSKHNSIEENCFPYHRYDGVDGQGKAIWTEINSSNATDLEKIVDNQFNGSGTYVDYGAFQEALKQKIKKRIPTETSI